MITTICWPIVTAVETVAEQWRNSYGQPLIARVSPGQPYPLNVAEADQGMAEFDELRALFDTQNADIYAARDAARAELREAQTWRNRELIAVLVVILGAAMALALWVRRAVTGPVAAVAAACRRIANGDFAAHDSG